MRSLRWSHLFYFHFLLVMKLQSLFTTMLHSVWFRLIAWSMLAWVVFLVWYEAYHAYMLNHTYYFDMLDTTKNRGIVFWMLVCACIPVGTILRSWRFSLKYVSIATVIALLLSWLIHSSYKWGSVWWWWIIQMFYTIILITFIWLMLVGIYTVGAWFYERFLSKKIATRYDVLFVTGIGLCLFLLLNYILVLSHLFYPIVARVQLWGVIYLIYTRRDLCQKASSLLEPIADVFQKESMWKWIFVVLLVISFAYFLFWFHLSFIPYSTAWDANHAYMYIPKVWAENHGFFRKDWPTSAPYLWMIYISYRFSLMQPLSKVLGLAPDTVAVVLNFMSWPLALIFGLGALRKVSNFFLPSLVWWWDAKNDVTLTHLPFALGWMYFLLWLMSGMGAFLVFVDNKTDLGVMALSMVALMGWFLFLSKTGDTHTHYNATHERDTTIYAILSWIFFSAAVMAKPTAFQDVLIFGLLMVALRWSRVGATWLFFIVLGAFAKLKILGIVFFLTPATGSFLILIGVAICVLAVILTLMKSSRSDKNLRWWIKPVVIRWATILISLMVVKLPYLIPSSVINNTLTPTNVVKWLIMGYNEDNKWDTTTVIDETVRQWHSPFLLAANDEVAEMLVTQMQSNSGEVSVSPLSLRPEACTLSNAGLTSDTLMDNLPEVVGWGIVEDLGRYIGFGQRVFTDPSTRSAKERGEYGFIRLGYPLLRLLYPAPALGQAPRCYGSDELALVLCQDPPLLANVSPDTLSDLQQKTSSWSLGNEVIAQLVRRHDRLRETSTYQSDLPVFITDIQKSLNDYMQSRIVQVSRDNNGKVSMAIPYGMLTPLNVIFNRSLQNLSSYYTDIGFVWIISLLLLLIGLVSTAIYRRYQLFVLHLVTLFGWIIRWMIASGIIWYAVGIVAWTLFTNALYMSSLLSAYRHEKISWKSISSIIRSLLALLVIYAFVQTLFNLIRMASQWWEWPFTWYKWSTGKEQVFTINPQGIVPQEKVSSFGYDDVFALQFGHYNTFINAVAHRKNEDGILIAGTYLQYFLPNQYNLVGDGLLTSFWQRGAGGDTCRLALRLREKNIKYLVIDPNIGSVVMGGGNASLFDRFLAKIDPSNNKIITDWTMTMLSKMIRDGYLKLLYTNNLAAKYAYSVSDADMLDAIQWLSDASARDRLNQKFQSDVILLRAKMAVLRFFPQEINDYILLSSSIFRQRLSNPQTWIADLADAIGKQIRLDELVQVVALMQQDAWSFASKASQIDSALTNDEKTVLAYYLNISQWLQSSNSSQAEQMLTNILQQSIGGGSQLVTFEAIL